MDEPFLTAELEQNTGLADWHERALRSLAGQLGFANDFFYPLIGAAQRLEELKRALRSADEGCRFMHLYEAASPTASPVEPATPPGGPPDRQSG